MLNIKNSRQSLKRVTPFTRLPHECLYTVKKSGGGILVLQVSEKTEIYKTPENLIGGFPIKLK